MAVSSRKPILISGAGIASLLFARSLLRASIPFQIFERDSSISFRAQGYRLRLSSEGLSAIESALGPDDFPTFWDRCSKTGGGGFAALDAKTGEKIPDKPKQEDHEVAGDEKAKGPAESLLSRDGKIVGISRGDMRKTFMSGCEPHIHWSHHVTGYEKAPSGVRAVFADGSKSDEGEMLVGGEGIYSKVAKQLSQSKLKTYDTGARGIHGQAPSTAFKALGEGVWRVRDDSNSKGSVFIITNVRPGDMVSKLRSILFPFRNPQNPPRTPAGPKKAILTPRSAQDDPNVQFGWTMGAQPGVINISDDNYSITGTPAAKIAKDLTADWHPRLKPLFDEMTESEAAFWKITCSTPSGVPEWPNDPRVTVIGDAVHSMTPAGGIGANTAVRDSALLGKLLAEAGGYGDSVTAAYEKDMRVYASEAVGISYGLAKGQFGVTIDENSPTV